jgi:tRNA-uridine 2-sulfurtransferase
MSKKVFVGLSGGVDSSVSAALLRDQGYDVTGVYMKNWSKDLPGYPCPWREDYLDAKKVAVQLGIPFKMFDFEKEYFHHVVEYMLEEYKIGRTPNPDIMCNQEIKFRLFLNTALAEGADFVATGHYARIDDDLSQELQHVRLKRAVDDNKDQTYFLSRVTSEALSKTLFPVGNITKPEVRKLAEKYGLVTSKKKESMGICFVGKVGIADFLQNYIQVSHGDIIDQHGGIVGQHDGAILYTIGQRKGLHVGGGLPFYVTGKDMSKNLVFVTTNLQDERLWTRELTLSGMHFINPIDETVVTNPDFLGDIFLRLRHRAPLQKVVRLLWAGDGENRRLHVTLKDEVRAVTAGQSAALYSEKFCLGSGIVA